MRLQLATAAALAAVVGAPGIAAADGTVSVRGVYYKERATRVMQPMIDAAFEVGARGLVTAHFLTDAITSASVSAGADNATPFTELRNEGGLSYTHELDTLKLGADVKYSTESDYKSFYVGARAELALAQKNTTLGIGGGLSLDDVSGASGGGLATQTLECEPGQAEQTSCDLTTYSGYASLTQILSPRLVVGVTVDAARLDGYQSNPYRTAIAGDELVAERHPTERTREAFSGWARYYLKRTETTLIGAYRYYRDTWKVHAHTPELRAIQQVGDLADASLRLRYHTQDSAFFFKERYPSPDLMFFSDDVKLSDMSTFLIEAKLGVLGEAFGLEGRWAAARFEGLLAYFAQYNRFGNAIIAHLGITVPFE